MKKFLSIIVLGAIALIAHADINTDKAMSKISRDTKNYISAEARATTEDEAYDAALKDLSTQIANYFETEQNGEAPNAVYLQNLSSIYSRLSSQSSSNRYRVMLYVKKSELKPLEETNMAMVLSKSEKDTYEPIPTTAPEQIVKTDTVTTIKRVEVPMNPTLSAIAQAKSKKEVVAMLTSMRKSGQISGAAAFPISSVGKYYLVVLNRQETVIAMLQSKDGVWTNLLDGENVKLSDYSNCSAYWITLP